MFNTEKYMKWENWSLEKKKCVKNIYLFVWNGRNMNLCIVCELNIILGFIVMNIISINLLF